MTTKAKSKIDGAIKKSEVSKDKKTKRRTRFVAPSREATLSDVEQISKFLKAVQSIDKESKNAKEQFEIVCLNTLGYTNSLSREILFQYVLNQPK